MSNHGLAGDAGVFPADLRWDLGVRHRQAADVGLVEHRAVKGRAEPRVVAPVEAGIDDHAQGHAPRVALGHLQIAVLAAELVGEQAFFPRLDPIDRLGVGIEEEVVRVEAQPPLRLVGAGDTVSIALPRPQLVDVRVPDERRGVAEGDARLVAGVVEEAEIDAGSVLGVDGEIDALAVPRRAERIRDSW